MYICPICNREFQEEHIMSKHLLRCWKEEHPYLQSKPAPKSEDINTQIVNPEVQDFFNSLRKK